MPDRDRRRILAINSVEELASELSKQARRSVLVGEMEPYVTAALSLRMTEEELGEIFEAVPEERRDEVLLLATHPDAGDELLGKFAEYASFSSQVAWFLAHESAAAFEGVRDRWRKAEEDSMPLLFSWEHASPDMAREMVGVVNPYDLASYLAEIGLPAHLRDDREFIAALLSHPSPQVRLEAVRGVPGGACTRTERQGVLGEWRINWKKMARGMLELQPF